MLETEPATLMTVDRRRTKRSSFHPQNAAASNTKTGMNSFGCIAISEETIGPKAGQFPDSWREQGGWPGRATPQKNCGCPGDDDRICGQSAPHDCGTTREPSFVVQRKRQTSAKETIGASCWTQKMHDVHGHKNCGRDDRRECTPNALMRPSHPAVSNAGFWMLCIAASRAIRGASDPRYAARPPVTGFPERSNLFAASCASEYYRQQVKFLPTGLIACFSFATLGKSTDSPICVASPRMASPPFPYTPRPVPKGTARRGPQGTPRPAGHSDRPFV